MRKAFVKPKLISASVLNRNADGYFYNAPSLGAELITNGGFAADTNWTKGAGWTIAGGVAVGTAATGVLSQSVLLTGSFYKTTYDLVSRTAGSVRSQNPTGIDRSTPASYVHGGPALTAVAGIATTTFSGTVDNVSVKKYTQAEAFVLCNTGIPYANIAAAFPDSPTVYAQSVIANCDSAITPANYLMARCFLDNAGNLTVGLRKFIGTTPTTIIANTIVTFASNAWLEIRRLPSTDTYQLFYNGVQVGADTTVTDTSINNNVFYGYVGLDISSLATDVRLNGITMF